MKNIQIYSVLLLFVFSSSCNGQIKIDEQKDNPDSFQNQPNVITEWQPVIDPLDKDPYFVGSNDILTSYGPRVITRNIIQDKSGAFWFATWDGIIRYDGKAFTNITNQEGLRRYRVFTILEDKKGDIWFGTIGAGVYRYDGETFTNFTTKDGLVNDRLGCIYEDKKGKIWFGTMGGVSCYDPEAIGTGRKTFTNFTTEDGLTNNDVNSIIADKNGNLWIGTRGDACFYDGKTFTNFKNKDGSSFQNVRCIIEDKKGNIWLGGNDGLWRYDPDKDGDSLPTGRPGFTNFTTDFVGYIYEDKKGNIWTSSATNGNANKWVLSRYDETPPPLFQATASQILTKEDMFFGILEDKVGGIWVGTLNGVFRYDASLPEGQGKSFNYFK